MQCETIIKNMNSTKIRFTIAKERVTLKLNPFFVKQEEVSFWQQRIYACWLYMINKDMLKTTQRLKRADSVDQKVFWFCEGKGKNALLKKICVDDLPEILPTDIPEFTLIGV